MKNISTFYSRLLVLMLLMLSGILVQSQVSKSAYFMDHLPVANSLNPAFTPPNTFFINVPVLSSVYLNFSGPIDYSQLTLRNEADDKLYINKQGIMDAMDEVETLSFDFFTELGRIGFTKGKHSFNFSVAKVLSSNISLEREFVKLLLYGNASEDFLGQDVTLSKTGINTSLYHEFGLGYAYQVNDKLSIGIKLKYLNGAANVWTEKAEFNVHTDNQSNYDITASTDILVHTSSAYGYLEDLSFDDPIEYLWVDFSQNHGFGGDLGVRYKPIEKLNVSASVVDLGMINWKENVKSYKSKYPNQSYTFNGFDISELVNGGSISDSITIGDSLAEHFKIEEVYDSYTSYLTPKAYFGLTYDVSKHDQFGFLIKGKFPENNFLASYTINYRRTFGDILAVYVNYTFQERADHIGLGLSLRAGPVMIYALNDMANALFTPTKVSAYNVQFGISFVFGKPYRNKLPNTNDETQPVEEIPVKEQTDENEGDDSSDDNDLNLTFINSL